MVLQSGQVGRVWLVGERPGGGLEGRQPAQLTLSSSGIQLDVFLNFITKILLEQNTQRERERERLNQFPPQQFLLTERKSHNTVGPWRAIWQGVEAGLCVCV